jgi:L-amino acid N-acyltransferase YncA
MASILHILNIGLKDGSGKRYESRMANLRMARESDAGELAAIYRPSVSERATSFELEPPNAEEMARRLELTLKFGPWLVATDEKDRALAYAYASPHHERAAYRWSVNVAVYVADGHHRRGLGRELYTVLFELLRLQGFYLAHAGITLPNPGSIGLHEAFGFRPVGVYPAVGWKGGVWHDVGWWRLELQPRPDTPAPPLSPIEARKRPEWAAFENR